MIQISNQLKVHFFRVAHYKILTINCNRLKGKTGTVYDDIATFCLSCHFKQNLHFNETYSIQCCKIFLHVICVEQAINCQANKQRAENVFRNSPSRLSWRLLHHSVIRFQWWHFLFFSNFGLLGTIVENRFREPVDSNKKLLLSMPSLLFRNPHNVHGNWMNRFLLLWFIRYLFRAWNHFCLWCSFLGLP